jgi:hypothetical protein
VKSGKWRLGTDRAYLFYLRATIGRPCLRINEKELARLLLNHLVCTPLGTQSIIPYCSARDVSAVWFYDLEKPCDLGSGRPTRDQTVYILDPIIYLTLQIPHKPQLDKDVFQLSKNCRPKIRYSL